MEEEGVMRKLLFVLLAILVGGSAAVSSRFRLDDLKIPQRREVLLKELRRLDVRLRRPS